MSRAADEVVGRYCILFRATDREVLGKAARKGEPWARVAGLSRGAKHHGNGRLGEGSMAQALSSDLGSFLMPQLAGFCFLSCVVEGDTVMSPGTVVLVTGHETFKQVAEGLAGREGLVNVNHHA